MSEFQEANIDTEPGKVADQEAQFLLKKCPRKFFLDFVYHWNRLLVATARVSKTEGVKA